MENKTSLKMLNDIFKSIFSIGNSVEFNFIEDLSSNGMLNTVNKLVHFGWKKEAIPISQPKNLY